MTEVEIEAYDPVYGDNSKEYQFQHKVTDVVFSDRSGIVIIGQELD
jgi:hypothetical protein